MVDGLRYFVAFGVIITFPAVPLFWILSHAFIGFWRRIGVAKSYTVLCLIALTFEILIYSQRDELLAQQFGSNAWLMLAAVLFYAAAVWIEIRCRKSLTLPTLVGLPEFSPDKRPQELLVEGIYSRIRHPRYVVLILVLIAAALVSNYLAIYLLIPVFAAATWLVTVFEERELVARFGDAYRAYQRDVPRLIPRFNGQARSL